MEGRRERNTANPKIGRGCNVATLFVYDPCALASAIDTSSFVGVSCQCVTTRVEVRGSVTMREEAEALPGSTSAAKGCA